MTPKVKIKSSMKNMKMRNRMTKRKMKYAHTERLGAAKGKTARVSAIAGALTAINDSSNRASIERARANNNVNFSLKADVNNRKELISDQSNSSKSRSNNNGDSENILGWIN